MIIAALLLLAAVGLLLRSYVAAPIQELRRTRGPIDQLSDIINAKDYGAVGNGVNDDTDALQSAIDAAVSQAKRLYVPAGTYLVSSKLVINRPGNDAVGMNMSGDGRGMTIFKYTGSGAMDAMLEINATGYSINNSIGGFKLDLTNAPADTIGLRIKPAVWRSFFGDIYITRDIPGGGRTGKGIYMGTATPGSAGNFDNKFSRLYINNFDINFHAQGTDLSGNTMTNLAIDHSYISSGVRNVKIEFFNGVSLNNSQLELATVAGLDLVDGDTAVVTGGSIESPEAGAVGITMDANTKSVIALCDFFNNAGGSFVTNGRIGHFYKSSSSGFVAASGSEIRIDSDGTNVGYLRFFRNGVADARIKVGASGNSLAFANSASQEHFVYLPTNKILDAQNGGYYRLNNGTAAAGIYSYHGSPEGNVTAGPGSICLDTTGGATSSLWVKETGSGNTGWVAK